MSWQAYVDQNLVGTGSIAKGAIFGAQGGLWAKSAGFNITDAEVATIIKGFTGGQSSYLIEGQKYLQLQASDSTINAKLGKDGLVAEKTNQAIVIGVYKDPTQPGAAAVAVGKLADFLRENGY
jgi:profilin